MTPESQSSSDEEDTQNSTQISETRGIRSSKRPARYAEFVEDFDEDSAKDLGNSTEEPDELNEAEEDPLALVSESDLDDYLSDDEDEEETEPKEVLEQRTNSDVDADFLLYCNDCKTVWEGDCPRHGPLVIVKDSVISPNTPALKTAPPQVYIGNRVNFRRAKGVFAKITLAKRTRFGPLQGRITSPNRWNRFSWLVRKHGKPYKSIDVSVPRTSNWMRYVKQTMNETEKNCDAFQYQGLIFFKTIREIPKDEELVVGLLDHNGFLLKQDPALCKGPKGTLRRGKRRKSRWKSTMRRKKKGKYRCTECNKLFNQEPYLKEHARIHTGERPFKCEVCDRLFRFKGNLDKHAETHEKEKEKELRELDQENKSQLMKTLTAQKQEDRSVCKSAETTAVRRTLRVRKIRTLDEDLSDLLRQFDKQDARKRKKREDEETVSESKDTLTKPMDTLTDAVDTKAESTNTPTEQKTKGHEKPYKCEICDLRCRHPSSLMEHIRTHTGEKPFVCTICNAAYARKTPLNEHMRLHTGEKPFECRKCQEKFALKAELRSHWKRHHGETPLTPLEIFRPFQCEVCQLRCRSVSVLNVHMRTHTGEKPYVCELCSQAFARKYYFNIHMLSHTGKKPFECLKCGKVFLKKQNFLAHIEKSHEGDDSPPLEKSPELINNSYECPLCNEVCSGPFGFAGHLRKRHRGDKPFVCKVCKQAFTTKGTYDIHMGIHSDKNPFECAKCNLRFAEEHDLTAHRRKFHVKLVIAPKEECVCLVCNFKCSEQSDLIDHMNRHTGDVLFVCDVCDKPFTTERALDVHTKMHKESTSLLLVCDVCRESFNTRPAFDLHIKMHRMNNSFQCIECNQPFKKRRYLLAHRRRIHRTGVAESRQPVVPNERTGVAETRQPEVSNERTGVAETRQLEVSNERIEVAETLQPAVPNEQTELAETRQPGVSNERAGVGETLHSGVSNERSMCLVCNFVCGGKSDLLDHLKTHTGEILFVCTACDETFGTQSALDAHSRMHSDGTPLECTECHEKFAEQLDLTAHQKSVHNVEKPHTIKVEVPEAPNEKLVCLACSFVSSGQVDMMEHMQTHTTDMQHICTVCNEAFLSISALDTHMRTHIDANPFECSECKQRFAEEKDLIAHKSKEHSVEKPDTVEVTEPVAQEPVAQKPVAQEPVAQEPVAQGPVVQEPVAQEPVDEEQVLQEPGVQDEQFLCLVCKFVCIGEPEMIQHMQTHSKDMLYVCNVCDEAFLAQSALDIHMIVHGLQKERTPRYVCVVCNLLFDCEADLREHMQTHSGEMLFVCGSCDETFNSQDALDMHVKTQLCGKTPKRFACPVCNLRVNCKSTLSIHMRIHTGEKPFKCTVCGRGFARRQAVTPHMRIHTGERPFKCSVCNITFAQRSNLRSHQRVHRQVNKPVLYCHNKINFHSDSPTPNAEDGSPNADNATAQVDAFRGGTFSLSNKISIL